jgi:hypothetical protein
MWSRITAIDSMPALVTFVADFAGLKQGASPLFI